MFLYFLTLFLPMLINLPLTNMVLNFWSSLRYILDKMIKLILLTTRLLFYYLILTGWLVTNGFNNLNLKGFINYQLLTMQYFELEINL